MKTKMHHSSQLLKGSILTIVMLCISSVFTTSLNAYSTHEPEVLKAKFAEERMKLQASTDQANQKVDDAYLQTLSKLKTRSQRDGDLDQVMVIISETEQIENHVFPTTPATNRSHKVAQERWVKIRTENQKKSVEHFQKLQLQYDRALEQLQKSYVRSNQLEDAVAIKAERDRVKKLVNSPRTKKPINSTSASAPTAQRIIAENVFNRPGNPEITISINNSEQLITSIKQLPEADFSITEINLQKSRGSVNNDDLKAISACSNLRILNLWGNQLGDITDNGITHLTNLTELNYIYLRGANISDRGASQLAQIKSLTRMTVGGTNITDQGLKSLSTLPNLNNLAIEDCKITDQGMSEIVKIKQLHVLNISGTTVTDLGIVQLTELKQLKVLHLNKLGASQATINRLKAALPECHITTK